MDEIDETIVTTPEFMLEIVDRFARDLVKRRITFRDTGTVGIPKTIAKRNASMWDKINRYFDQTVKGKVRADLVKEIFCEILKFNLNNWVVDNKDNPSIIEKRIDDLEKKIATNNRLLVSVLKILNEVGGKLDRFLS